MGKMDWRKVRAEYIADRNSSYRALALKYGYPRQALARRGKAEGWPAMKRAKQGEIDQAVIDAAVEQEKKRHTKLLEASDTILEHVVQIIQTGKLSLDSLQKASRILRDIKAVQDGRPELDEAEQEARIEKLRKATAEDAGTGQRIEVVMEGIGDLIG